MLIMRLYIKDQSRYGSDAATAVLQKQKESAPVWEPAKSCSSSWVVYCIKSEALAIMWYKHVPK